MRLFLDANILFAAAFNNGAIRRLLKDLRSSGHTMVIDGYVWEEARRNLSVHRSSSIKELHELISKFEINSAVSPVVTNADMLQLTEKDRPIVAGASALHCEILTTGDRTHFRDFYGKRICSVEILSPVQAAEKLLQRTPGFSREVVPYSEDFAEPLPDKIISEFEK